MIRYYGGSLLTAFDVTIRGATPEEELERVLIIANIDKSDEFAVCQRGELLAYLREPGAKAWACLNPYDEGVYGRRSLIWAKSADDLEKLYDKFSNEINREYP